MLPLLLTFLINTSQAYEWPSNQKELCDKMRAPDEVCDLFYQQTYDKCLERHSKSICEMKLGIDPTDNIILELEGIEL